MHIPKAHILSTSTWGFLRIINKPSLSWRLFRLKKNNLMRSDCTFEVGWKGFFCLDVDRRCLVLFLLLRIKQCDLSVFSALVFIKWTLCSCHSWWDYPAFTVWLAINLKRIQYLIRKCTWIHMPSEWHCIRLPADLFF